MPSWWNSNTCEWYIPSLCTCRCSCLLLRSRKYECSRRLDSINIRRYASNELVKLLRMKQARIFDPDTIPLDPTNTTSCTLYTLHTVLPTRLPNTPSLSISHRGPLPRPPNPLDRYTCISLQKHANIPSRPSKKKKQRHHSKNKNSKHKRRDRMLLLYPHVPAF